jgi:hypothetical protein
MTHVGEQEVYGVERDRVGALFTRSLSSGRAQMPTINRHSIGQAGDA